MSELIPLQMAQPLGESSVSAPAYSQAIGRAIDNTALDAFMRCPRLYYYGYNQDRRREGPPSPAIAYGSVWHKILETHYRSGGDLETVIKSAVGSWTPHDRPDDFRTLERACMEYGHYLQRFGTPKDEAANGLGKTVGYDEGQPLVEIAAELWWPGALHPYTGKIDRIIEWQGNYYVEDHKTTSVFGSDYFQQFELSNQMMGYAWLAQLISGKPIAGVRINVHAVYKASASKFERQVVSYSPERLREWAENYNHWIVELERAHGEGKWQRNFNACKGKYSMCQYAEVCGSGPRVREKILEQNFAVKPWNPLATDELE